MNQPSPKLYKIRPSKLATWRAWCEQLQTTLHDEATDIIANEGLLSEFFIGFKINEEFYTIGVMIKGLETRELPATDTPTINEAHSRIMRECLEPAGEAAFSYFLLSEKTNR